MHEISPIFDFLHFKASDSVVPIQPGDTSNVEETSYFTASSLSIKCLNLSRDSSMPRHQNPRLSRNRLYSLEGLKLCNGTGMIQ